MKKKSSFRANKLRSQEAENLPKFKDLYLTNKLGICGPE